MRILIVSATAPEVSFLQDDSSKINADEISSLTFSNHALDVLITGVGMTLTAFHLGKQLQKFNYDLALNIGLAGALNFALPLGEVVQVTTDSFGDLGAEDDQAFLNIFQLGLADENKFPFKQGKLHSNNKYLQQLKLLKVVEGITVNKVHGNNYTIEQLRKRTAAEIETMEGAAFLYACNYHQVDCVQLRSISNYVEKRDKSKWDIPLALQRLKLESESFLNSLPKHNF